jgi:hypothetical protein
VVEGRVTRHPLYFHLLDAEDSSTARIPSCAVCGRRSNALVEDVMDVEHGLLYCDRNCILRMERIRLNKAAALEEARAHIARQQGIPPPANGRGGQKSPRLEYGAK